jgi:glutamate--cysteine ligase catalytic subunit
VGLHCRWNIISASVDDRTQDEKGYISKSRYSSVSMYLGSSREKFNDLHCAVNAVAYDKLIAAKIPKLISKHVAHLFVRDPLFIVKESIYQNPRESTDHFESLQSTNWQSLRFKLPPIDDSTGWRVEFRTMDIQISDLDNSRLIVFVVLLSRMIMERGCDWHTPISQVDENMQRAHWKGAVTNQKFWWRNQELLLKEILEDIVKDFEPIVKSLTLEAQRVAIDAIQFVMGRARGSIPTDAKVIREFYVHHPNYRNDGSIDQKMFDDLINQIK